MTHLSLFSGYEGFGLGLRLATLPIQTIGYVEIDEYCQKVLQARIRDGFLDWAPIIRDVRRADFGRLAGLVDLITAGFPCQPHSAAGLRAGAADERNLWPATVRAIRDVGPRWVLLENVPGILANGYAGTVVGELAALGYDSIGDRVPAAAVGAPHLRWRWFCLAYADGVGCSGFGRTASKQLERQEMGRGEFPGPDGQARGVADSAGSRHQTGEARESRQTQRPEEPERRSCIIPDPHRSRLEAVRPVPDGEEIAGTIGPGEVPDSYGQGFGVQRAGGGEQEQPRPVVRDPISDAPSISNRWPGRPLGDAGGVSWWDVEPALGRVVDGHPHRVDQVRALGNGIVPAVVAKFLRGRR